MDCAVKECYLRRTGEILECEECLAYDNGCLEGIESSDSM